MSTGLIALIKEAAMNAVDNAQMCDLRFGEVVSISPLKVRVTNNLTIPSSLLIVPERLTNHTVTANVSCEYGGTKTMTIYGALKIGDKVALLRKQGGQSYFILDRI